MEEKKISLQQFLDGLTAVIIQYEDYDLFTPVFLSPDLKGLESRFDKSLFLTVT